MVYMIPEEGSFSLSAYVATPGYQTIIPKGFLLSRRQGEVWIAPLIPQLFYGVTSEQLGPSWRQYLPEAGEHVILSRVAGKPEVPREELYWRKISEEEVPELQAVAELDVWTQWTDWLAQNWVWFVPVLATLAAPVIGAGATALWDYIKLKGWIM